MQIIHKYVDQTGTHNINHTYYIGTILRNKFNSRTFYKINLFFRDESTIFV